MCPAQGESTLWNLSQETKVTDIWENICHWKIWKKDEVDSSCVLSYMIVLSILETSNIDMWHPTMRASFEEVYGTEHLQKHCTDVITAYGKNYLTLNKGFLDTL